LDYNAGQDDYNSNRDYYLPPQQMVRESDVHKHVLDPTRILSDLEHHLRGESWVERKVVQKIGGREVEVLRGEWVVTGEPMCNEKGVKFIISSVSLLLDKNTTISSYDEGRMMAVCRDTMCDFTESLFLNAEAFDLKKRYYRWIVTSVADVVESAYRRAVNGGERRWFATTESVLTSVTEERSNKGGGLFDRLFKGGGK